MQNAFCAATVALAALSAGCASSAPTAATPSAAPTGAPTATVALRWEVLTSKRPGLTRDLPPGKEELAWVANSAALLYGERDAVLVDTFLTTESKTLVDWVAASGKNLTTICITHGHGDHFFGLAPLLERFPRALVTVLTRTVGSSDLSRKSGPCGGAISGTQQRAC